MSDKDRNHDAIVETRPKDMATRFHVTAPAAGEPINRTSRMKLTSLAASAPVVATAP